MRDKWKNLLTEMKSKKNADCFREDWKNDGWETHHEVKDTICYWTKTAGLGKFWANYNCPIPLQNPIQNIF